MKEKTKPWVGEGSGDEEGLRKGFGGARLGVCALEVLLTGHTLRKGRGRDGVRWSLDVQDCHP